MALDDLVQDGEMKFTVEDGVRFYIEHLKENKEDSYSLISFYLRFNPATKEIRPEGKAGKFKKYYSKFRAWRKKGKLPADLEFEDWVKQQISPELKQELEELTNTYFPNKETKEYSLEEGVRFYIDHLKENKENSCSIIAFYKRFDPKTKEVIPSGKTGKLQRHYGYFRKRKKGNLPKNLSFEDWIKQQISPELRIELEELTNKYFPNKETKEYSLEDGARFYIEYMQKNKENSRPIKVFFTFYSPETNKLPIKGKKGSLNKYYSTFSVNQNKGEIPKDLDFVDWLKQQVSPKLAKELEDLTNRYFPKKETKEYSLEDVAWFYINHLRDNRENSVALTTFTARFNPETKEILNHEENGELQKHYCLFTSRKRNGKLQKSLKFEDYIIQNLPEEKRAEAAYYLKGQYLKDCLRKKLGDNFIKGALLE